MEILRTLRAIERYTESIPCYLEGQELFIVRKATEERYLAVLEVLRGLGFCERSHRQMGEVLFDVLVRENESLFCSFSPNDRFIRVVRELDHRFSTESPLEGEVRVNPLVTQLRGAYLGTDAGMGYLIRLSDGRFIMIDGFVGEYEEPDYLMDVIRSQNQRAGKPVIAAWFVTHPHGDHYFGTARFMKKYGDAVELKHLIYNFPRPDMVNFSNPMEFNEMVEEWRDRIEIYTPHAGERFVYGDACFDVLCTGEDLYPDRGLLCNSTSLVMMMELAGRRVLWLGDLKKDGGDFIARRYPAELLQCEFLQVGHHGYGINSKKLYRTVNPEVLMWPCADYWYPVVSLSEPNQLLLSHESIRVLDICGQGEVTYDFTKPVEQTTPYRDFADGETVYLQRFECPRVLDLWWNSVVGGASGYRAPKYALENGALTAKTTAEEVYSVVQFVQRGQMDRLDSFTLCVRGKCELSEGLFGLFWNYPNVTVFDESALWEIPAGEDGAFEFCLSADAETKKATLACNGKTVRTDAYEKQRGSGLNFVLKNAVLTLHEIKLIKGVQK
ncbi:MAG: MBL fold metallo-hydrolase [Ruminococcaceae bacterium]|nr:MBL fold metallo-hydrolase [Oscillospiraceae bacterium]